jgi:hypothetical protein
LILSTKPIPLPGDQKPIFEEFWRNLHQDKQKTVELMYIYIKKFTEKLLMHIHGSIVTNISTSEPISSFIEELYLMHFPRDWRQFVHNFVSTQMMMFTIEQESRRYFESFNW